MRVWRNEFSPEAVKVGVWAINVGVIQGGSKSYLILKCLILPIYIYVNFAPCCTFVIYPTVSYSLQPLLSQPYNK
jgi:hypothetical protein